MRVSQPFAYDLPTHRASPLRWLMGHMRSLIFLVIDNALMLLPTRRQRCGLAVILPHGMGDLLLFAPAYRDLCAHFPGQPVTVVCMPGAEPVVASYLLPSAIITADRAGLTRRPFYRIKVLRQIAKANVRFAVQPGANRSLLIEDSLIRHSRAEVRIGSQGSDMFISRRERCKGDRWYTRLLPEQRDDMHESQRAALFMSALTGRVTAPQIIRLSAPVRHSKAPVTPYLVACCETSSPLKTWPLERFIQVARQIAAERGLQIVMAGHSMATPVPGTVDLRGRTGIGDLIALLAHASFVLSAESAPSILAAALRVPSVVVGGGGTPGRYLPFQPDFAPDAGSVLVTADPLPVCAGCGWRCRYIVPEHKPAPCVAQVSTAQVLAAARAALP